MIWRQSDFALSRDPSGRFLTGLLAVMVFLAALALSGGLAAQAFVGGWTAGLANTATVQVPPSAGATGTPDERREAVLRLLRVTPGVLSANPVPREEAAALVAPWLGADLVDRLPMPTLIDIRTDRSQPIDLASLATRLENAAPGTVLDDHGRWIGEAQAVAAAVTLVSAAVLLLVVTASAFAVVFAVRSGISVHREEIEILALIGAPDRYIARQFEARAARSALIGGIIGGLFALATLVGVSWLLARVGIGQPIGHIPGTDLPAVIDLVALRDLVIAVLAPIFAMILAVLSARIAVYRSLNAGP